MTSLKMPPIMAKRNDDDLNVPLLLALSNADMTKPFKGIDANGKVTITAEQAPDGESPKLPTYSMVVYTGGVMSVGYYGRVVVDLMGLKIPNADMPALRDHNTSLEVGHGKARIENGVVLANGVISGTGEHVVTMVKNQKNGMPYQASIGVNPDRWEDVEPGKEVSVNGRTFVGPLMVCREGTMNEHSFVLFGADPNTSSRVAAKAQKEGAMKTYKEWLEARGFSQTALSAEQSKALEAMYKLDCDAINATQPSHAPVTQQPAQATQPAVSASTSVQEAAIAAVRADRERARDIEAACDGDWGTASEQVKQLCCAAIESGETVDSVNAKLVPIIRASRQPVSASVSVGETNLNNDTLSAALCIRGKVSAEKVKAQYGEKALAASSDLQQMRLREFINISGRMAGVETPYVVGDGTAYLKAAMTNISLTNVLESATTKILMDSFEMGETVYQQLAEFTNVTNFQPHNRYRLSGTGDFREVRADGELHHGDLSDQKFSVSAGTYGSIVGLSRQDIINDDLDAFLAVPRMMGDESQQLIDHLLALKWLSNTNGFFGTSNGNYEEGAGTALTSAGTALSTMRTNFRTMKRPKLDQERTGKRLNLRPKYIIVPPELEDTAQVLVTSRTMNITGGSTKTKEGDSNPHFGRYEIITAPFLSDDYYTGHSLTAWYLMAERMRPFVVSFLNGKRTPTINSGWDQRPDHLGFYISGYIDVGVDYSDPIAARMAKGV